ncbi:RNA polymerase sigma factor, sigma-70 family [Aliiroseovarius halocynthiae]|uniref:RNA polymerase sigma factor n=1 Tax=Aliiroseovarius halocynthiae TaxID=985055 RepID=A0A545SMN9_9RHOB|nr:RNA polymerase sigma factor [Aliiroseovarius halocynthiae]TQV66272.1 RNA polymerase sigma factor [Aliiroseovarius halocynthiae]SMR82605.1 RNA polymerase sigma factor, sigma-70 family [Aliiroseovarius halocynthiae]
MSDIPSDLIARAQSGEAIALEQLVIGIQDRVHRLAIRMLADPVAAQDATQEILIRIVTKLSTFKGDSRFETWTHRVATNYLLTARKAIAADPGLSFQMFSEDLLDGLADEQAAAAEDHVMLNELRIRCTTAMLLCLDRDHRAAYVLGEILELDHSEAASILDISPANFRKRLSRARISVQDFTAASCGLANAKAPCSCRKRLPAAMKQGRIGELPSADLSDAPDFSRVRTLAAQVGKDVRAIKLQRATGDLRVPGDFRARVLSLTNRHEL